MDMKIYVYTVEKQKYICICASGATDISFFLIFLSDLNIYWRALRYWYIVDMCLQYINKQVISVCTILCHICSAYDICILEDLYPETNFLFLFELNPTTAAVFVVVVVVFAIFHWRSFWQRSSNN